MYFHASYWLGSFLQVFPKSSATFPHWCGELPIVGQISLSIPIFYDPILTIPNFPSFPFTSVLGLASLHSFWKSTYLQTSSYSLGLLCSPWDQSIFCHTLHPLSYPFPVPLSRVYWCIFYLFCLLFTYLDIFHLSFVSESSCYGKTFFSLIFLNIPLT